MFFLTQKTDDLHLAPVSCLVQEPQSIFHILMQDAVPNTSCHWQKKASSFPHGPTSPQPLLMLAQVQQQQQCHAPGAWAPAPPRVPRQPWAGGTKHKHLMSQPASPPCPQAGPFSASALSPSWEPLPTTSSHHRAQWSGTQKTWPVVCICLPEQEDLQSPDLRLFGANDQRGVFKLVEPTVQT